MAYFDPSTGQLVLQIVYDGAAYSGKTASIESLSRLLNEPVLSPEVEDGRTLLFDWMEYEGGARFGRPIVCRVLTVPGQRELSHRRLRLIRDADGVIFVADSRRDAFDKTVERWQALMEDFAGWSLNSAVTVQLNHRDDETALPAAEMHETLGSSWSGRFFETVAIRDEGTREAFVMTVGETLRHHLIEGTLKSLESDAVDTQTVPTLSPEQLAAILYAGDKVDTRPIKKLSADDAKQIPSKQ